MNLKKLEIIRFKGFDNFQIEFKQFNVLVGENGSGKSTILEAIQLLHDSLRWSFLDGETPSVESQRGINISHLPFQKLTLDQRDSLWFQKDSTKNIELKGSFDNGLSLHLRSGSGDSFSISLKINDTPFDRDNEDHVNALEVIYKTRTEILPPIGTISAQEQYCSYPQLKQFEIQGKFNETWRRRLWWANEQNKELFTSVAELIREYLPDIYLRQPRIDIDGNSSIRIEFEQQGTILDIGLGGGGIRTLISLAVMLQQSKAQCILLDEPDAHLHSKLQQLVAKLLIKYCYDEDVQIIAASHAPDFIKTIPSDARIWVDRKRNEAYQNPKIEEIMEFLGVSPTLKPISMDGVKLFLFVEDEATEEFLSAAYSKKYGMNLKTYSGIQIRYTDGSGAKGLVKSARSVISLLGVDINFHVVGVIDRDYENFKIDSDPAIEEENVNENTVIFTLGKKEIENYLLDANSIHKSVEANVQRRRKLRPEKELSPPPSLEKITEKIKELTQSDTVNKLVRSHFIPALIKDAPSNLHPSTAFTKAEAEFDLKWKYIDWRIKICPGKTVWRQLCNWLRKNYGISIDIYEVIGEMEDIPSDIDAIVNEIRAKVTG